jgi:GntR family transcriptional repressor for pyruvate dehydrogenase complex
VATFRKVQVGRASEDVIRQVEQAIFSGEIRPGNRLPSERELTEQFGVSRVTVRDALRVLEANGLVDIRVGANGGAFIREPNFDRLSNSLSSMLRFKKATLLELAEARKVIETATAEFAAQRAEPEDLERLREAVEGARRSLRDGDLYYMPHSVEFHTALAEAARNRVLYLTVASFRKLFFDVLEQLLPTPDMAETAARDHWAIYQAVAARDGALARRLMAEHLAYFESKVQALQDEPQTERQSSVISD